jgi:hypothetical protein
MICLLALSALDPMARLAAAQDRDLQGDIRRDQQDFRTEDATATTLRQRAIFDTVQIRPNLLRRFRPEAADAEGKPFELDISIPFAYNSNPQRSSGSGDGHVSPELQLLGAKRIQDMKFSALGDINATRYLSQTDVDADEIYLTLKAAYSPMGANWAVYLSYTPIMDFQPDFAELATTYHDLLVGATKSIEIPMGESAMAVDLELFGGRREADPKTANSWILQPSVKVAYVVSKEVGVSAKAQAKVRWFDEFEGRSRDDQMITIRGGVRWRPDWLTQLRWMHDAHVLLSVQFVKNFSSRDASRFTQWDVGPSMNFKWEF